MKIALVQTGKTTDKDVAGIADLYISRIRKYTSFEVVTLPDIKNPGRLPVQEQKIKEGKKLIQLLFSDDYVVLLDEKGKELRRLS
jgi:23S rRNA (pseudouridine1915-N3)-methyltransferase